MLNLPLQIRNKHDEYFLLFLFISKLLLLQKGEKDKYNHQTFIVIIKQKQPYHYLFYYYLTYIFFIYSITILTNLFLCLK